MSKETIRIDSRVLQPLREIAGILGVPPKRYVEEFLESVGALTDQLVELACELENMRYETREEAERAAERFDNFVVEMELGCIPNTSTIVSTISTEVVLVDGGWTVKTHRLGQNGKGWKSLSLYDDGDDGFGDPEQD